LQNSSLAQPEAVSAGFHPVAGRRVPESLADVARKYSVDLNDHCSRFISKSEVEASDAVFVMDLANYRFLVNQFPSAKDKTYLLGLFANDGRSEIADPYNNGKTDVRVCCEQLVSSLEGLMKQILRG
jgi:protein-tyrosine phosphatase